MKTKLLMIITACLLLLSQTELAAQANKEVTTKFTVSGVCALCKKRIEDAAKGKGVQSAIWDIDSRQLTLV